MGMAGLLVITLLVFSVLRKGKFFVEEVVPTKETVFAETPFPTPTTLPTVVPTPTPACEREWVMGVPVPEDAGCPGLALVSAGSKQEFQHGLLIWIEAQDRMIAVSWDGSFFVDMEDQWDAAVDQPFDASIVPPDRLQAPEYGFGKVWREVAGVREALGWAVEKAPLYEVRVQGSAEFELISLPDNRFLQIDANGVTLIDQP